MAGALVHTGESRPDHLTGPIKPDLMVGSVVDHKGDIGMGH